MKIQPANNLSFLVSDGGITWPWDKAKWNKIKMNKNEAMLQGNCL